MRISSLAAAIILALVASSASAEECIEKNGEEYCTPRTVEVVVVGPSGHQLDVNRSPAANAVAYCDAKGGYIGMDFKAPSCTLLLNGGYSNCPGACFSKETGDKIDG